MQTSKIISIIGVIIILSGCSTLSLTTEQTIEEYSKVNKKLIYACYDFKLDSIRTIGTGWEFYNGLEYIYAYNKDNKKCRVKTNDKTTLRITKKNGRKVNMYFDTSFLMDSCLYGKRSHFFKSPVGPFKITELKKIEIQTSNNLVTIVN